MNALAALDKAVKLGPGTDIGQRAKKKYDELAKQKP